MKIKQLIKLLEKQDQKKEVMIQANFDEFKYMKPYTVRERFLYDNENTNPKKLVVIEYE